MGQVVAFSTEQTIAMWAHARRLRRAAFACVAGALLAAVAALALDERGAFGCGVLAVALVVAATLLTRRARFHEQLSAQRLERLGRIRVPERPPTEEELGQMIERMNRKRYRFIRTWRP